MPQTLLSIELPASGTVPEWIHLIPAGRFSGVDGRGPFVLPDPSGFVKSFNEAGRKLPIDENHSIDLSSPTGGASPARGWIVALEARDDGIWGRVEWTDDGRRLVEDRSYGFVSPVLLHGNPKPHRIKKILRASLTNAPNLEQLASLHAQETPMDEELRAALGLSADASDEDVLAAVQRAAETATAHAALMPRLAEAAGVDAAATGDALVYAINALDKGDGTKVADLQSQLTAVSKQLQDVVTSHAQERAVAVVDAAVEAGKVVPALRDHMIARHTRNPKEVETEIAALPSINAGGLGGKLDPATDKAGLTTADRTVCSLLSIDPEKFAETKKAEAF